MRIIIPIISVIVLFAVLTFMLKVFNRRKSVRATAIRSALSMILCCNSYDKMLDVYTALDQNTTKCGIEIQYNYRGYFR